MTRNKTYEESPTRGTSKYLQKEVGDLIKDRATGELILVIDRLLDEIGVSTHCMVQFVGEGDQGQQRLATWFVDYECEKL